MELYKKHRPKKLGEIVGQNAVVNMLASKLKKGTLPHTLLFAGPSGCGKTTLARILRIKLQCSKQDYKEINCANFRGIDTVRSIQNQVQAAPLGGKSRIWMIDEAHKLSNDAQNAILKLLEDTPRHVYFMLATTDPQKLLKAIHTRSTKVAVKLLTDSDMSRLILDTCKKEQFRLPKKVLTKMVKVSEGSARKALVFLEQVLDMKDEKKMLEVVEESETKKKAFQIAQALHRHGTQWSEMARLLKDAEKEDAESLRRLILSYATKALLGTGRGSGRAYIVIDTFRYNLFESGWAGFVANCYQVLTGVD
jgi:DNA polymerase-3 subunit gamma/tau